eukprot:scaffold56841_cov30-Tisochrysis_lutea.AAC.6
MAASWAPVPVKSQTIISSPSRPGYPENVQARGGGAQIVSYGHGCGSVGDTPDWQGGTHGVNIFRRVVKQVRHPRA